MSIASRGTRVAARSLRTSNPSQFSRRNASGSHDHAPGHGHGHGHGESALHLKNANITGNEGFGSGTYLALATVPLFYVGYNLAYGSEDNYFARLYLKYKEGKQATADADKLHQTVLAQAVADRARLSSYPRETTGPELMNPEMFNAGSPWNQAAGEGSANMKELEQHYKKVHADLEEERLAKIKDGKIRSLYD